jgi:outer membrane phospholipase A
LEYKTTVPIINNQITINGKILLNRDNVYTNYVVPYQKYKNNLNNGLNVYAFSLNPMEGQPSGCLNFSAIKKNDIKLNVSLDETLGIGNNMMIIKVISRSYNILRIFSGMGACIYNL